MYSPVHIRCLSRGLVWTYFGMCVINCYHAIKPRAQPYQTWSAVVHMPSSQVLNVTVSRLSKALFLRGYWGGGEGDQQCSMSY